MPDGLWVNDTSKLARETLNYREANPKLNKIRFLSGVAKYTDLYTDDPKKARWQVRNYANLVDVATTNGEGTGHPPSIEKIAVMKPVAKFYDKPLAVANGISTNNF